MGNLKDWNRKEFYLTYCIRIILIFTTITACLSYMLDYLQIFNFDKVNILIIDNLLINREGILISVASIFIGIYFGIFTILLSIKSNSKIVTMGIKTFKELIQYIKHAFIGSFIYIIYAIIYPLISILGKEGVIKFSYELLLGLLVVYMLLSAMRVGIAFILIFKSDLETFFSSYEIDQIQTEEYKGIIYKLKSFLDAYEQIEARKKTNALNDINKIKNPKSDKSDK